MAFKRQTSFIDDPDQEDYLNAGTATPKYVAPDPVATPTYLRMDTPAQSPVNPAPDGSVPGASWDDTGTPNKPPTAAELRQQVADLAAQRPEKGKAGIWRTLAAIGAGTAIGYGSRGPQGQENVNNVVGAIMYPGYTRKAAEWSTKMNDTATQAEQAEKIESDARAGKMGDANLAHVNAQTRLENAQADNYNLPNAPPSPEWDLKDGVLLEKRSGQVKPSPIPVQPKAQGDANMQLGIATWKRIPGNEGKEPGPDDIAHIHQIFNPVNPAETDTQLAIRAAGGISGNKAVDALTPPLAKAALDAKRERPERPPNEAAQKGQAINRAFVDSGNDWNKVLDNVRAGKYTDYAGDIAEHAQKMTQLKPDAQRKVVAADTTAQQVQAAIDGIDEVTKAHPDLVGPVTQHPLNALNRRVQTFAGSEPADVGTVDSILETAAALQPGQHNFRSIGALADFKKSLGIDPRTGKADGSRAWLANPEKAKAALKAVLDFNQRLKDNTLKEAGQGSRQVAPNTAPAQADPLGIR